MSPVPDTPRLSCHLSRIPTLEWRGWHLSLTWGEMGLAHLPGWGLDFLFPLHPIAHDVHTC